MKEGLKGSPLWTAINNVPAVYPWLSFNENCEICVIGGGITGALCAMRFAQAGKDTVLLAAGPVGYGGTSGSSGVMQADMPGGLNGLASSIGMDRAVMTYKLCEDSLSSIEQLINELDDKCGFYRTDSLTYSADNSAEEGIRQEYLVRKHNDFEVELIDGALARDIYSFDIASGILSKNLAGVVDPYQLTHAVLAAAQKAGARIYENSPAEDVLEEDGSYILSTETRHEVNARSVVMAIGSECSEFLKGCGIKKTSFNAATVPVQGFSGWPDSCVVNSIDHPEITFSITPDSRILASGLETGLWEYRKKMAGLFPLENIMDKKFCQLETEIQHMFPGIRNIGVQYEYSSSYEKSEDGLPIIGAQRDYPGCYFAQCGGPNGILFSEIASRLILDLYNGEVPEYAALFAPERQMPVGHRRANAG